MLQIARNEPDSAGGVLHFKQCVMHTERSIKASKAD
jgi:hypothetical protein